MNKKEFLEKLNNARAEWAALLAQIPKARMMERVSGEWTVKDIVAHVTWGEREMVGVLLQRALVGSDLWNVSQFERNDAVFQENRQRGLEDVLSEAESVHASLMNELTKISDAELNEPRYFRAMPPTWLPWQVIAGNTYEHYPEHVATIRAWLEKT